MMIRVGYWLLHTPVAKDCLRRSGRLHAVFQNLPAFAKGAAGKQRAALMALGPDMVPPHCHRESARRDWRRGSIRPQARCGQRAAPVLKNAPQAFQSAKALIRQQRSDNPTNQTIGRRLSDDPSRSRIVRLAPEVRFSAR
jgi:hypothetical protein